MHALRRLLPMDTMPVNRTLQEETLTECKGVAFAAINGLPDDLLIRIFWLDCTSVNFDPRPNGVLRLCHVCQRWRSVVNETTAFWGHIQDAWSQMTRFLLKKSGVSPLSIKMFCGSDNDLLPLLDILEEVERVNKLHLVIRKSHFSIVDPFLRRLSPSLEELSLVVTHDELRPSDEVEDLGTILDYALSAGSRRLRIFQLTGFGLAWNEVSASWSHLSVLKIATVPRECLLPLKGLLSILSKIPKLEQLALQHATLGIDPLANDDHLLETYRKGNTPGPVPLLFLSEFVLFTDDIAILAAIEKRISVSSHCALCFRLNSPTGSALQPLFHLGSHMENILPDAVKSNLSQIVQIVLHQDRSSITEPFLKLALYGPSPEDGNSPWKFSLEVDPVDGVQINAIHAMCGLVRLDQITTLVIGLDVWSDDLWNSELAGCNNVSALILDARESVCSLTPYLFPDDVHKPGQILFPKLSRLTLGHYCDLPSIEEKALLDAFVARKRSPYCPALEQVDGLTNGRSIDWTTVVPVEGCLLEWKEESDYYENEDWFQPEYLDNHSDISAEYYEQYAD